jgi:cytochrome c
MKPLPTAMMLVTMLLAAPMANAADQATPDEAKAMAIKAVEYLKSAGPEKAFAEFDAKDGRWHDRDLYVTVLDSNGVAVAQGNNPGLVGAISNGRTRSPKRSSPRPRTRSALVNMWSEWVPTRSEG